MTSAIAREAAPPTTSAGPTPRSRVERWKSVALFVALACIYSANGRESGAGDTVPALLLPVAILRGDGLQLDRFAAVWPNRLPYYVTLHRGHIVSQYPVAVALLALPLIAPQLVVLDAVYPEWESQEALHYAGLMGKNAAALIAALTGVALLGMLRQLTPERFAWLAAWTAALGSNLWAVASQSAWQHGPTALALTLAVWLLLRPDATRTRLCLAGLASAALVAIRPQNAVFSLAIFAWVALRERARTAWFLPFPLAIGALLAASNFATFGNVLGGYAGMLSLLPYSHGVASYWTSDVLGGASGTLVSPSRGLFFFSPWVLLSLATLPALRDRLQRWPIVGALLLTLIPFLLQLSLQSVWWAGHSFGPRYWTDVIPVFAIVLAWALEWSSERSRPLFGALLLSVAFSIGVQAIGAFCYPSSWSILPGNIDMQHERLWDWRDSELTRCLSECRANRFSSK